MKKLRTAALLLVLMGASVIPSSAQTQMILGGTYTGGSNFATTMSGALWYHGNGVLQLDLTAQGPGVFAAVGLVNVPSGIAVSAGAPGPVSPGGEAWTWETTQQLSGDGLAENIWAWVAPSPAPEHGLSVGDDELSFFFNVDASYTFADLANVGFGVHSIAYQGCSTKLGVWNGGTATNDVGEGNYGSCASVPEPSPKALLAVSMIFLAVVVRRRREDLIVE